MDLNGAPMDLNMERDPGVDAKGRRLRAEPVTTRSKLMLEVASELVGRMSWRDKQTTVLLRPQGAAEWALTFFGSDTPDGIDAVVRGDATVAIVNPAEPLTLAYRGTGPYTEPQPVRVITNIPSYDQFAFAVMADTGLRTLGDIREQRYPLKLSLRGQRDHSVHFMTDVVLKLLGFTLDDLKSWGGEVRFDPGLPNVDGRIGAVGRGEINAIFDEAVGVWANPALDLGMRMLDVDPPIRQQMEEMGWRFSPMPVSAYPKLGSDLWLPDFSGWPVFCRADAPDALITAFCDALDERRAVIPWQGKGPLPLESMCKDGPANPLDVPLHPAAERFWRERGYLR